MAKDKKSFVLYCDQKTVFSELSDKQAGILIKHIFSYVNDENPSLANKILKIAFEPIKQQLKRDLKDWEAERSKRSEAGKIGGIKSGESRRMRSKRSSASKNEANEADNVTVNVTDTVNVTEREKAAQEIIYSIEHCSEIAMKDDRWVSANKASADELKEFNAMLERLGVYQKNPKDYKSHFARWKNKGQLPEQKMNTKTQMVM
ncbi:MAG: DUF6291 domain-containing protein [Flavisolibacter sp.]|jgi:hypothetical protein